MQAPFIHLKFLNVIHYKPSFFVEELNLGVMFHKELDNRLSCGFNWWWSWPSLDNGPSHHHLFIWCLRQFVTCFTTNLVLSLVFAIIAQKFYCLTIHHHVLSGHPGIWLSSFRLFSSEVPTADLLIFNSFQGIRHL